ncbi:MAG: hypothetical protein COB14_07525 [Alphaproteobacteria bacterium]|nr:MAG: hypothetical protein COB14_07525 [Alphaproteobacteria bacterium]
MSRDADWMEEEDDRAEKQDALGVTANADAPVLVRKREQEPPRATKGFYIQDVYSRGFDRVVFEQKMVKGKKAPELAEEAILLLLKKYDVPLK